MKEQPTFLQIQLHLCTHHLESAAAGVNRSVEWIHHLERSILGHGQIHAQLALRKLDDSLLLIHLLGKYRDDDVAVSLVKVIAAVDELLLLLTLRLSHVQVLILRTTTNLEKLIELQHASLAATVALRALVEDRRAGVEHALFCVDIAGASGVSGRAAEALALRAGRDCGRWGILF